MMDKKFDLSAMSAKSVYLKPIEVADLPAEVRAQARELSHIFAVHNGEGEQVAYVADAALAAHLAAENAMQLVTLH